MILSEVKEWSQGEHQAHEVHFHIPPMPVTSLTLVFVVYDALLGIHHQKSILATQEEQVNAHRFLLHRRRHGHSDVNLLCRFLYKDGIRSLVSMSTVAVRMMPAAELIILAKVQTGPTWILLAMHRFCRSGYRPVRDSIAEILMTTSHHILIYSTTLFL